MPPNAHFARGNPWEDGFAASGHALGTRLDAGRENTTKVVVQDMDLDPFYRMLA